MCQSWYTVFTTRPSISFVSFRVESLIQLVLGIQHLVLPVLGQRQLASLSMQMAHEKRQRKKQLEEHEQGKPSNRQMQSGKSRCWKS